LKLNDKISEYHLDVLFVKNNCKIGERRTWMRNSAKVLFPRLICFVLLTLLLVLATPLAKAQQNVTSPEEFFGFQLGSDRNIARWDKIVEYYYLLETESDKLKVIDMGPSTEGNPFLVVIISSADNLSNLDRLQEINMKISDPRGIAESEIKKLVQEGKAVICQSMSLHATEIGGTQMAPELTYDLITRMDEETKGILNNVVFFLIPSFNPDGQILTANLSAPTPILSYGGNIAGTEHTSPTNWKKPGNQGY
jgi:hypothetical protein